MKTLKEIADSLGVSKQRVYRYVKKNHISEAHHEDGVMWFDDVAENTILKHFSDNATSSDVHQCASNDTALDTVIDMLKKELDIKNEQIRELNERLAESNTALLSAQALHAGNIQKQLTDGSAKEHKSFFARLFRKMN